MTARIRQGIALLTLLAYLPACSSWQLRPETQPIPRPGPEQSLQLTLRDGRQLRLSDARVIGDSIVGQGGDRYHRVRTAVSVAQIQRVAERRPDTGLTALAVIGVLGGALLVAGLAIQESLNNQFDCLLGCPK